MMLLLDVMFWAFAVLFVCLAWPAAGLWVALGLVIALVLLSLIWACLSAPPPTPTRPRSDE